MFRNNKIFLITLSFLFFSNVFSVSIFKRAINILQGPVPYIAQNHKEVKKGFQEPFYWFTNSTSASLDAAICHEVAHTLVGHKLGFRITKTSVYKDMILRFAYVGKTDFELKPDERFKNKTEIDSEVLRGLDSEFLTNIICLALAGGIGTEIVYGQDYGMSGDDKMINFVGAELIKRDNTSVLDNILLNMHDFSFVFNLDFNIKIKEIRKECYEITKGLIVENRDILDKLRDRLKNSSDKILLEDEIKEIINGKKEDQQ